MDTVGQDIPTENTSPITGVIATGWDKIKSPAVFILIGLTIGYFIGSNRTRVPRQ